MFYWLISQGTLSSHVKEVYISYNVIVFTRQTQVQNLRIEAFLEDNNAVMTERDYCLPKKLLF